MTLASIDPKYVPLLEIFKFLGLYLFFRNAE